MQKIIDLLQEFTAENKNAQQIYKVEQAIQLLEQTNGQISAVRLAKMITKEGFTTLFYEVQNSEQCNGRVAFEILNNEYHTATGKFRFASYESFKTLKDR